MTSALETCIREAVEKGGWNYGRTGLDKITVSNGEIFFWYNGTVFHKIPVSTAFLDPAFFQALGRARGWGDSDLHENNDPIPYWKMNALHFMTHIMDGKDAETFFVAL